MGNKPLVSIVIPVYNRENIVSETIESAINQTYRNIEIIIGDNCSTDATYEVIEEYAKRDGRIRIFQNKENVGPVRNWRACIEKANGKYVKILFSDDLLVPEYIEKTLPYLLDNENIGFVYSSVQFIGSMNSVGHRWGKSGVYKIEEFVKAQTFGYKSVPVSPGCALFRKRDLLENLMIDIPNAFEMDFSKYGAGNDLLLFLLCANKYKNFAFLDSPLSLFRAHQGSFSISNNLARYYVYSKVFFVLNIQGMDKIKNQYFTILNFKKNCKEFIFKEKFDKDYNGLAYEIYIEFKKKLRKVLYDKSII